MKERMNYIEKENKKQKLERKDYNLAFHYEEEIN